MLLLVQLAVSVAPQAVSGAPSNPDARLATAPDVIVIVTDDQRWDTLAAMPKLRRDLVRSGVTFTDAYTVTPSCCPSRAGILTGRMPAGTGVWRNSPPFGGFESFDDERTIATLLQEDGYTTGLFGKYLNGYESSPSYVPPGWDRWYAHVPGGHYDYTVSDQGNVVPRGDGPSEYSTNDIASHAVSFIEGAAGPLFAFVAFRAPHFPYTPPPGHEDAYAEIERWRPPSYDESNVADKPSWVRSVPRLDPDARRAIDRDRRGQYRMLLGVDDGVGAIVQALRDSGRLANALIFFLSDNGFSWGEHRLVGKGDPYEESIRIPFIVRYDPLVATPGSLDPRLVLNLDIAATIAAAVGAPHEGMDGHSLLPLLEGTDHGWRGRFLTMMYTGAAGDRHMPSFCQIHTRSRVLTVYASGEEEDYRLGRDPWQLGNLAETDEGRRRRRILRRQLKEACVPAPPDMIWP